MYDGSFLLKHTAEEKKKNENRKKGITVQWNCF
jgi:hypothetical protein